MTSVYTVGHSNHTPEAFLALLRQHAIELLVDGASAHCELESLGPQIALPAGERISQVTHISVRPVPSGLNAPGLAALGQAWADELLVEPPVAGPTESADR